MYSDGVVCLARADGLLQILEYDVMHYDRVVDTANINGRCQVAVTFLRIVLRVCPFEELRVVYE
jgi:hypothetical protein